MEKHTKINFQQWKNIENWKNGNLEKWICLWEAVPLNNWKYKIKILTTRTATSYLGTS